jgi:cytochrome c556
MRLLTSVATALLLTAGCATLATADTSPENAIRYRKAVMTALGGHVGAIMMINGGRVDQPKFLLPHAEALASLGEQLSILFPAGSGTGKTDALAKIWKDPVKFQKAVDAGTAATAKVRDAARGGDKAAIGQALKGLGEACKGCHDNFRKEESKP